MYHQTNPTELFRERQLALLQEADNRRRLARRLHGRRAPKARSTIAVLAWIIHGSEFRR